MVAPIFIGYIIYLVSANREGYFLECHVEATVEGSDYYFIELFIINGDDIVPSLESFMSK